MKITLLSVGKTKEKWLIEGFEEYAKRLKTWGEIETIWVKTDDQLIEAASKYKKFICLDEKGESLTTAQFAKWLSAWQQQHGAHLTFVIGGADGLSPEIKQKATALISFSRLTFTHQMIRLFLAEQLYRAFSLSEGLPYHRN